MLVADGTAVSGHERDQLVYEIQFVVRQILLHHSVLQTAYDDSQHNTSFQHLAHALQLCCRLWPLPTNTSHPIELHPVAAATVSCLTKPNGRVLWSPAADQPDVSKLGQWVTVNDACFISATHTPSKALIKVGRQAGLHMVDMPEAISQVIQQHCCLLTSPKPSQCRQGSC